MLHQHFVSDLFFEISSFRFPMQRRFSWISRITFRVLGVQFNVLQVFLKRFISLAFWLGMMRFRNIQDFVPENSLKKWTSMRTSTTSALLNTPCFLGSQQDVLLLLFHLAILCFEYISPFLWSRLAPSTIQERRQIASAPSRSLSSRRLCRCASSAPPSSRTTPVGRWCPLVLEEESDQLKEVDGNTTFEPQTHVSLAHIQETCRHASLHQHPVLGQMLADHLVVSVKPPDGEPDGLLKNRTTFITFWFTY